MTEPFQCGLVLLAAGGSRRMGRPKQLLPIRGKPLVRHVAEAALAAPVASVVVVLGAEAEQVRTVLKDLPLQLALNPNWQTGLSSSLRVGVQTAMTKQPDLHALIISLADQPELSSAHVLQMIERYKQGGCNAVASLADDTTVPPILFDRSWFDRLCSIQGDIGAKALLKNDLHSVATVAISSAVDLDTPEEYERFIR